MNVRNKLVAAQRLAQLSTYCLINSNADADDGISGGRASGSDLDHETGKQYLMKQNIKKIHSKFIIVIYAS